MSRRVLVTALNRAGKKVQKLQCTVCQGWVIKDERCKKCARIRRKKAEVAALEKEAIERLRIREEKSARITATRKVAIQQYVKRRLANSRAYREGAPNALSPSEWLQRNDTAAFFSSLESMSFDQWRRHQLRLTT